MTIKFMLLHDNRLSGNIKELTVLHHDPDGEYTMMLAEVEQPSDLKILLRDGRYATPQTLIVKGKEYFVTNWNYSLLE